MQTLLDNRTRADHLRRLAVAFASELRLKIITEVFIREMSPKRFFDEFGGGSPSRVSHNFRKLFEHDWLRLVRTETGGDRRGGVEHFYRGTELAIFDAETWSHLPYSLRVAFSWTTLRQLEERIADTFLATGLARPGAQASCDLIEVDEAGWRRVIAAMDRTFSGLFDEQRAARERLSGSEDGPIEANVVLLAFEPADPQPSLAVPRLAVAPDDPLVPFPLRISKILNDELSLRILAEANKRDVSALQIHSEFGGDSPSGIRRRFRMLESMHWLQMTSSRSGGRRRGAAEKFYRASTPVVGIAPPTLATPVEAQVRPDQAALERMSHLARESMIAGTFDLRTDRYATWSALRLDEAGWERTSLAIADLADLVHQEAERSQRRLSRSGKPPIPVVIGLANFEAGGRVQQLY